MVIYLPHNLRGHSVSALQKGGGDRRRGRLSALLCLGTDFIRRARSLDAQPALDALERPLGGAGDGRPEGCTLALTL